MVLTASLLNVGYTIGQILQKIGSHSFLLDSLLIFSFVTNGLTDGLR